LSVTRPFDLSAALYYKWSIVTMRLSCTVTEIWHLKDNGVTNLTFWGHVTSSVTWPFDSRGSTSYPWSMVTMRLSATVTEIWCGQFSDFYSAVIIRQGLFSPSVQPLFDLVLTTWSRVVRSRDFSVPIRSHILRLWCANFDFGCGSAPDPTRELTALFQTP